MNRTVVNIQGLEYTLKGDESEEYLARIGYTVNHMIDTMMRSNRKLNLTSAAILTGCNLADEKFRLEKKTETIKEMEKEFEKKSFISKEEIDSLTYTNQSLRKELEKLKEAQLEEQRKKEEEIRKLLSEVKLLQESIKQYKNDNEDLSKANRDLKFELQSYKYKVLDLQNKMFETQVNTVKDKKAAPASQRKAPVRKDTPEASKPAGEVIAETSANNSIDDKKISEDVQKTVLSEDTENKPL